MFLHGLFIEITHGDREKHPQAVKFLRALDPTLAFQSHNADYIKRHADKMPTYDDMMSSRVWNIYRNVDVPPTKIYNEYSPVDDVIDEVKSNYGNFYDKYIASVRKKEAKAAAAAKTAKVARPTTPAKTRKSAK